MMIATAVKMTRGGVTGFRAAVRDDSPKAGTRGRPKVSRLGHPSRFKLHASRDDALVEAQRQINIWNAQRALA